MVNWGYSKRKEQSYIKKPKRVGLKNISGSLKPNGRILKALKTSQSIDDSFRNLRMLLPKYKEYVKRNYPHGKWFFDGKYWYWDTANERIRNNPNKVELRMHEPWMVELDGFDDPYDGNIDRLLKEDPYMRQLFNDIQKDPKDKQKQNDFLKEYVSRIAKREFIDDKKLGSISDNRVIPKKNGYGIEVLLSPVNQFMNDVLQGNVTGDDDLKLSVAQVLGQKPEGGYLHKVDDLFCRGTGCNKDKLKNAMNVGYYKGLVVRLSDVDPDLDEYYGKDWVAIKDVLDDYHYIVTDSRGREEVIRDTDVAGIIGDYKNNYLDNDVSRYQSEIKPLAELALGVKRE